MKIEVGFPIKSFRFTDGAIEEFKGSLNFSTGTVATLESKVVITKILSDDDNSSLTLRYEEDFNPDEGLRHFFSRAEEYARNYFHTMVKAQQN
ncbi:MULTISPECIES: hypothetical protein [Morganellaceae]|uniref:Phage protein n=1 Tax=Providencia vermicola TaxID=333965 RepID=A0AAX3RYD0_9GAMM|nr:MULTISPECIES: hypothetical protein [Morganellaceae]ELX8380919.1 hypothetical protein [Providencia stuartii]EMD5260457.1 hypothetical protein [Providencia stuartii]MDC9752529.1 hypothetical protein [Proteus mirabilis]MDM3791715.1 hypothetical protein [Proteus mirabilis]USB37053.1 hypothetical protein M5J11_00595 [Providencia vermicola]